MTDTTKPEVAGETTPNEAAAPAATDKPAMADAVSDSATAASADSQDDAAATDGDGIAPEEIDRLTTDIVAALKTVQDPEIPADIYELGLIYRVEIDDDRAVKIDMTLTAPGCPVAGEMPVWVENAVNAVPGVAHTTVKLTFDPPWDQSRMSDEAKLAVGMF